MQTKENLIDLAKLKVTKIYTGEKQAKQFTLSLTEGAEEVTEQPDKNTTKLKEKPEEDKSHGLSAKSSQSGIMLLATIVTFVMTKMV